MRTAYFFEGLLPGPNAVARRRPQPAAGHRAEPGRACAQTQGWNDVLARQQAIYEELLASPEWAGTRDQPTLISKRRPLSARELTRDLAGWSPPQLGALRAGKP